MMKPELAPLSVSIRDLGGVDVVCVERGINVQAGDFSELIADGFREIKGLTVQYGHDPSVHKVIGVPHVSEGQLAGYACCVPVPISPPASDPASARSRRLIGGRYAVLTLDKDSATIGTSIGRFFAEYVPAHKLALDHSRPSYEIYGDRIMEFCVPVME